MAQTETAPPEDLIWPNWLVGINEAHLEETDKKDIVQYASNFNRLFQNFGETIKKTLDSWVDFWRACPEHRGKEIPLTQLEMYLFSRPDRIDVNFADVPTDVFIVKMKELAKVLQVTHSRNTVSIFKISVDNCREF